MFENFLNFSFWDNQSENQKDEDRIIPPIQIEVTLSSMPSNLETPRPATTAIVHTGHTAYKLAGYKKV